MPGSTIYLLTIASAATGLLAAGIAVIHALTRIRHDRQEARHPAPHHAQA
jgi:hypothetical protein